jgi:hypothetical protein
MGRYINTALGQRWSDEPHPNEPSHLQYPSRGCLQSLGRISAKVDHLVSVMDRGVAQATPLFSDADVDEVGRLLVEGRISLPTHARLTVITTVEEVRHKLFNTTTDVITHEADQLHTKLLRPMTVLEALEAGLLVRLAGPEGRGSNWLWARAAYERLAAAQ